MSFELLIIGAASLLIASAAVSDAAARGAEPRSTYYVNNVIGSDDYNGLSPKVAKDGRTGPFRTIAQAILKATPGSTVSMAATSVDYREEVRIVNTKKGSPAAPFVLDGNGATVTGLLVVPKEGWTHLRDDIYWTENRGPDGKPRKMPNSNWLGHWKHQGWFAEALAPEIFFLDGKVAPHTQSLETIPQGGFFYDTQAKPRRLYFRLPKGKKIDDCTIEFPQNEGVYVEDDYIVVRNLRSIYSQDDGFSGFWGIGDVFENINGSFNCDQGYSVHGTNVTLVDGGLFERNGGCGICDVMSSSSTFRNCVVKDNFVTGALMMGLSHTFLNCRFIGNHSIGVVGDTNTSIMLVNCLVDGGGKGTGIRGNTMRLDHCTVVNCETGVVVDGRTSLTNSIITGTSGDLLQVSEAAAPIFSMGKTILGAGTLVVGSEKIDPAGWSASRFAKDNTMGAPDLKAPVYELTDGSKWEKSPRYDSAPGVHLPVFKGWNPTKPNKDYYPRP